MLVYQRVHHPKVLLWIQSHGSTKKWKSHWKPLLLMILSPLYKDILYIHRCYIYIYILISSNCVYLLYIYVYVYTNMASYSRVYIYIDRHMDKYWIPWNPKDFKSHLPLLRPGPPGWPALLNSGLPAMRALKMMAGEPSTIMAVW